MTTIATITKSDSIQWPEYDRNKLTSRIVHLGFGAFHRAHQGLYTCETAAATGGDWGICEINLFGGEELVTQLRDQDHLYTVVEKGADKNTVKVAGAVTESLHPTFDGKEAVLEKMAEPQVAIVSMTITEKGYCADPATGRLDKNNPLIQHDVENRFLPDSAIGYIVEALRMRRERGLPPFTVMSCDNVQENGHVARAAVLDFAMLVDQELAGWIEANVTFPCTMVDRIVPAATQETLSQIEALVGVEEPCGIACEPFRQWVIEDNFVNGRPDWDVIDGATFVEDVVPYEEMKLRMLNGSHSFLAYLGYLGGYAHISDTMINDSYRKAALDMMLKAQAPSLDMPEGTDLESYANLLIERFTNPSLKHQTWQIAMDGSQKIPQRMGGSLRFHLEQGTDYRWLATGIAGWMRYVGGIDEKGEAIDVRDPMAEQLAAIHQENSTDEERVRAYLSVSAIFGEDLIHNESFVNEVVKAYQLVANKGARAAVASL
ncbi:fructuronate reductase [Vibrio sp. SCSIO 43136]|uniref:fructuronate reductase n=1 Tax=Vibrio sp. SCSIO 43136 TaxID=2819101 RepID=UPI002074DCE7|nr:fructuronate reductase [Vibrio sp. SCSIO 43136]USD67832.1 fructuronate reductase [Vibrio sp. SCSIO 43136]